MLGPSCMETQSLAGIGAVGGGGRSLVWASGIYRWSPQPKDKNGRKPRKLHPLQAAEMAAIYCHLYLQTSKGDGERQPYLDAGAT